MSIYKVYNRWGYPIDLGTHEYAGGWKAIGYWSNEIPRDGVCSIPHIRGKYDEEQEQDRESSMV